MKTSRRVSFAAWVTLFVVPVFGAEGSLKGVVKFDGPAPTQAPIPVPAGNQKDCNCKTVADETLVVDPKTNGIQWAIVRIMGVKAVDPPKPAQAPQIDQKGCRFVPHVLVVAPETDIEILNPDGIGHNFHSLPMEDGNIAQNFSIAAGDAKKVYRGKWLGSPEIVPIKCDMHAWMTGQFVVHDPRFCAVTGADGTFEIKGIPPGKYEVNVYQEKFGNYFPNPKDKSKETFTVEIKDGSATDLGELKFAPKKKKAE